MSPVIHNLLCVDFDSFFPDYLGQGKNVGDLLFDWGHREAEFFIDNPSLWAGRGAAFVRNGLPLPGTSGEEATFWQRFRFTPGTVLHYADSNACAALPDLTEGTTDQVWLYDAHHDSGYRGAQGETMRKLTRAGKWSCENWMVLYRALGADLHMRYPQWKAGWAFDEPKPIVPVDRAVDDGTSPPVVFDRVFVCRSGAWVPPWLDDAFEAFVRAAPFEEAIDVQSRIQPGVDTTRREFSMDDVHAEIAQWDESMRLLREHEKREREQREASEHVA